MSRKINKIGKCTSKSQGKIIVKLEGTNLPKIGSRAYIMIESNYKQIGFVLEIIGITKSPWVVISAKKGSIDLVNQDDDVFVSDKPVVQHKKKKRKFKKRS